MRNWSPSHRIAHLQRAGSNHNRDPCFTAAPMNAVGRRAAKAERLEQRLLFSTIAIVSGQTQSGTIDTSNLLDTYTFAASAGDSIVVTMAEKVADTGDPFS